MMGSRELIRRRRGCGVEVGTARMLDAAVAWGSRESFAVDAAFRKCAHRPTRVRVLANRLVTDDEGTVTGALPEEPIHAKNKKDAYARLRPWFAASATEATRLLVFGDSVGDAAVAAPVPASSKACVGFFDPANPWGKRAEFEAAFDCLLPHDGSLAWLTDHLMGCTTTR